MTVIKGNACAIPAVASSSPRLLDSVGDGGLDLLPDYGDCQGLAREAIRVLTEPRLRAHLLLRRQDLE